MLTARIDQKNLQDEVKSIGLLNYFYPIILKLIIFYFQNLIIIELGEQKHYKRHFSLIRLYKHSVKEEIIIIKNLNTMRVTIFAAAIIAMVNAEAETTRY